MPTIAERAANVTLLKPAGRAGLEPVGQESTSLVLRMQGAIAAALGGAEAAGEAEAVWLGEGLLEVVWAAVAARQVAAAEGQLLVRVRRRFGLEGVVAACAGYARWVAGAGQPARYGIRQLLWALVAGQLLGLSLRGLEERLRQDWLVRWFCGFAGHEQTPDHSTLGRFWQWLAEEGGDAGRLLLGAVVAQIAADFPDECKKAQLGDTFALHARAGDTDRTVVLRDGCLALLGCLERAAGAAAVAARQAMGEGWQLLFGVAGETPDSQLPRVGRDERECRTARGAALCLALVRAQMAAHGLRAGVFATRWAGERRPQPRAAEDGDDADGDDAEERQRRRLDNWLDVLDKVLADEFIFAGPEAATEAATETPTETVPGAAADPGQAGQALLPASARRRSGNKKSKEGAGPYRIGSMHDLHATYRLHGESTVLGYNVGVLTTDAFVHQIIACTGARADGDMPALLLAAQIAQTGAAPAKLIFDRAAGAPKRFADVARVSGGRTQLVAPLFRSGRRGRGLFGPDDFHLVEQAGVPLLACPGGQTTRRACRAPTRNGWKYRFLAAQCNRVALPAPGAPANGPGQGDTAAVRPGQGAGVGRCPLWDKCRAPEAHPDSQRTVLVSNYVYEQRQALAYLTTPAYREDMRQRAAVERIIAGLTRCNGARYARSTGIAAANLQMRMAALSFNLKSWHVRTQQRLRPPRRRRAKEPPDGPD